MAAQLLALATLVVGLLLPSSGFTPSRRTRVDDSISFPSRRVAAAGLLSSTFFTQAAHAFDNAVVDEIAMNKTRAGYDDKAVYKAKYPGTQPALGLEGDGTLKKCDYAPNCFSTSGDGANLIKPLWKPSAGSSSSIAMAELLDTIKSYPPGQARIDRGGFSIIDSTADYLYVQFESIKFGFIDDVEFKVNTKDESVQVRSASRMGFLDLGVNAKRLNWISASLREKGWTAPAITKADYPDYFEPIFFSYDDYIRSVLSPKTCPDPIQALECK